MKFAYLLALFFLAISNVAVAANAQSIDCLNKIPRDLAKKLAASEPDLRLVATHDLDSSSVDYDLKSGGDGCYVVAKGRFDGSNRESIAIVLVAKDGHPDLVVASKPNTDWLLHHLPTFCDDIKSCYVKRGDPGKYVRSDALDTPPDRESERAEIKSKHDVVVSGRLESTGITYFDDSGKWLYVWTSD